MSEPSSSESSSDSDSEPAPAACLERTKRSTAGTRMSSLVGKAAEEDEAFWSQSFFEEEEDDEDNESFRSSDESIENQIDTFDSDFDESEGEEEANAQDIERGKVMEAEIAKEQRRAAEKRSQKGGFVEGGVSIARQLLQKKMGRERKKRALLLRGEGVNAGLVLPDSGGGDGGGDAVSFAVPLKERSTTAKVHQESSQTNVRSTRASSSSSFDNLRKSTRVKTSKFDVSQVMHGGSTSFSKTTTTTNTTTTTTTTTAATATNTNTAPPLKKTKRRYTQEELLLEALEITEPENKKWLLGRKRDMAQTEEEKHKQHVSDVRVIQKFHSRRGCYNTLTFPEMDHVPVIFDSSSKRHIHHGGNTNVKNNHTKTQRNPFVCVITGKKARYRDPRTMLGYHDIEAFKELRRRFESGELKIHSSTKPKKNTKNKRVVPVVPAQVQSSETADDNVHTEQDKQPLAVEVVNSKKKSGTKTGKVAKDTKRLKITKETTQSNAGAATPNVVPSIHISIPKTDDPNEKPQEKTEVIDISRSGRKRKKSEKMMASDAIDNGSTKVTKHKKEKVQDVNMSTNTKSFETHTNKDTNTNTNTTNDSIEMNTTEQTSLDSAAMVKPSSEQHDVKKSHAMIPASTVSDGEVIHHSSTIDDITKDNGNMDKTGQNTLNIESDQTEYSASSFPCFNAASFDIASMFAMSLISGQSDEKTQRETANLQQSTSNGDHSENSRYNEETQAK